ncbi:MAG: tRNA (adenosine(37)-N6)-threonylcarbamoyltransferase complex ATPase subunit type 1 TsaE [Candidatus Saccharimonadales bacterium]
MIIEVENEKKMRSFGQALGMSLNGGEIIELVGDIGAGKTTLVKGIAVGLGIVDNVQSPSFTINRVYSGRDEIILSHYDFYRLNDAGIMADELTEVISAPQTITVIEWAEAVQNVLPADRLTIEIIATSDDSRRLSVKSGGQKSEKLIGEIK